MKRPFSSWLLVLSLLTVVGALQSESLRANSITQIEFLGEARITGGLEIEGSVVGGLSGITFDRERGVFYVVSDDPSGRSPARFYTVEIDLADGRLDQDGVQVTGMTMIRDQSGGPMSNLTVDPEGIALFDEETIYVSSEGQVDRGVAPFVRRFSLDGTFEMELDLPGRYSPDLAGGRGPRHNLGFESLTLTPDKRTLFTALENALLQDGPEAALDVRSPSRLIEFDTATGELRAEYLYMTEPVADPSTLPDGMEVSGLVDLLALGGSSLLSMERSFSMGPGNTVLIFQVDTEDATDLRDLPALNVIDLESIRPVRKELLFDLRKLNVYIDNLEGMTLGPDLSDGRRTLILVADDNFNPLIQVTQLFAFALADRPVDVGSVQGAAHRSPLEDRWVSGVEGVVTVVRPGEGLEFWMEDPDDDGDPSTSSGVLVAHPVADPDLEVGDEVEVAGMVRERQRPGELSTTWIESSRIRRVGRGRSLPSPVELNEQGRKVPTAVVDDDGLGHFEPRFDGLDFWESLEGMRVVIRDAVVIGPTNRYGDLTIDAGQGSSDAGRTRAGGLLLQPGDLNPERLVVFIGDLPVKPAVDVGARFVGDLTGVVDYAFGRYRLHALPPLPTVQPALRSPEATELRPGDQRLTIATFNVMNLSARDSQERFRSVAGTLVDSLGSPDIVALQEVQDDSGRADDGTVTATRTLGRLIDAVVVEGGPVYESRWIDPRNNQDGGQPGSNIRLVYLFNPLRVEFVDRGAAGADDAVQVLDEGDGPALSLSPGRVAPLAPAFGGDEERGFSASRKPLAAEFRFGEQRLFLIDNHWASKRADDRAFGDMQPPSRHSEDQRSQQARLVADFVREILDRDSRAGVIVLGDLNEHEFRSPLHVLGSAGLANLVLQLPTDERYTFNYHGNSQMLDHILIGGQLLERAKARVDIVHINSDFAHGRSSSDHDPVVVEMTFGSRQ